MRTEITVGTDEEKELRPSTLPRDTAQPMSQENVEIVRRLFERWATGDLTADCFDFDTEYLRIGAKTPDMEGRWEGLDEISTAMRHYLRPFSDLRIECGAHHRPQRRPGAGALATHCAR